MLPTAAALKAIGPSPLSQRTMHLARSTRALLRASAALALVTAPLLADGEIKSFLQIDDLQGGLGAVLSDYDYFGWDLASIGDLDGDRVPDFAAAACVAAELEFHLWMAEVAPDGSLSYRAVVYDTRTHPVLATFACNPGHARDSANRVAAVADFNHDGEVRTDDFVQFLDAYAAESWRADIAAPRGVVDTIDVLAFIQAFIEGCDARDLSVTLPD